LDVKPKKPKTEYGKFNVPRGLVHMINDIYFKLGFRSITEYIITKIRSGLKDDTDFLLNFEKVKSLNNKPKERQVNK